MVAAIPRVISKNNTRPIITRRVPTAGRAHLRSASLRSKPPIVMLIDRMSQIIVTFCNLSPITAIKRQNKTTHAKVKQELFFKCLIFSEKALMLSQTYFRKKYFRLLKAKSANVI